MYNIHCTYNVHCKNHILSERILSNAMCQQHLILISSEHKILLVWYILNMMHDIYMTVISWNSCNVYISTFVFGSLPPNIWIDLSNWVAQLVVGSLVQMWEGLRWIYFHIDFVKSSTCYCSNVRRFLLNTLSYQFCQIVYMLSDLHRRNSFPFWEFCIFNVKMHFLIFCVETENVNGLPIRNELISKINIEKYK